MAFPCSVSARTARSISSGGSPGPITSRVTLGRSSASGGWSHSWVTAVTSSPTPRANSISVAEGTSDTIRIPGEDMSEWRQEGEALVRDYEFKDFAEAMAFVNRVADLAEEANHHPDILVHGWNRVRLTLSTHSEGGLTRADFDLAARIDALGDG